MKKTSCFGNISITIYPSVGRGEPHVAKAGRLLTPNVKFGGRLYDSFGLWYIPDRM